MSFQRASRSVLLLILPAAITTSCVGRTSPELAPAQTEGRVIGAEEIARLGGGNAWEVLQRAGTHLSMHDDGFGNPTGLTNRGWPSIELSNSPLVYLDGVRISDFKRLEGIAASSIERIQILNGVDATKYYGTGAGNGVIAIITRA